MEVYNQYIHYLLDKVYLQDKHIYFDPYHKQSLQGKEYIFSCHNPNNEGHYMECICYLVRMAYQEDNQYIFVLLNCKMILQGINRLYLLYYKPFHFHNPLYTLHLRRNNLLGMKHIFHLLIMVFLPDNLHTFQFSHQSIFVLGRIHIVLLHNSKI